MSGDGRLDRIVLMARAPQALTAFFVQALGFAFGAAGEAACVLSLGDSRLDIERASGAAYPAQVPPFSPLFQHFAIVTSDMAGGYARLAATPGWTPISEGGPQRLPPSSGGAIAFKFRDPEGHPLELIEFAGGMRAGQARIDHSALSVADVAASIAFYEDLGLDLGARTLNFGPAQDRLDGLAGAQVDVVALELPLPGPHVELLGYRGPYPRPAARADVRDVAATRLVLTLDQGEPGSARLIRDPDGHLLQLEAPSPPAAR